MLCSWKLNDIDLMVRTLSPKLLLHIREKVVSFRPASAVPYVKIGTIQRRLAWPLHKDDTCSQNGFTYGRQRAK
ncbi:uncharacterized protein MELLADRAFT_88347 [Melampsora larici-populina 98AG31]|uniref:Uncharacterized protein n=1 Tax=Melampsora larici-populina (strain 98AG31 / pathotype 3-4-7) TaxID=747676 RepID=F4RRE2_MELLP|nr:uncharacterized protein MELLADRAFT_88347 [Melampsora larici-populina 98AG31]EGG04922.1 hypothetical protein MELLADRAFT_88347 [Melampsora larici-populina 98AG31]